MLPKLTAGSRLVLHRFKVGSEVDADGNYTVVRWDTDQSFAVNLEAIKMLYLCNEGKTPGQIATILKLELGNVLYIFKFFETNALIKSIDGQLVPDTEKKIKIFLPSLKQSLVKWTVHPVVLGILMVYVGVGIVWGFWIPGLVPNYDAFFGILICLW